MRTLVVGDMHLGCGAAPDIFAGARAFEAMLEDVTTCPTRVVLNGDTFDFLAHESDGRASAEQLMYAFTEDATNAGVLAALGRVVARGGRLVVRAGEHDRALEHLQVQAILRRSIGAAVTSRVEFAAHDHPTLLEIDGVRVAVVHDVHGRSRPSARWLATHLLNPLRRHYGVGLADLLRPDYVGAVVAALAVNPTAAKHVLRLADDAVWPAFAASDAAVELALPRVFASSGLTARERRVLTSALNPGVLVGVSPDDAPVLEQARIKLLRRVLAGRGAGEPRRLVGVEWQAARALARRVGAQAVVLGHSRTVGWRSEASLTAVDAGTWTWLIEAPPPGSSDEVWLQTLAHWQRTATWGGAVGTLRSRLTAALIEPATGGARLALLEWRPGSGLVRLRERAVSAAPTDGDRPCP
jgi:UDP-2,3-diacylglucosamine pyrophosphatase LpxH